MTESVTDNGVNSAPDPERGWSRKIVTLTNPVVFPPLSARGHWVPAGIRASDGSYCPQGATWRYTKRMTVKPQRHVGDVPVLAGRWLWCGLLMGHFGHFLTESTTRLWALDQVEGHLDGLVLSPNDRAPTARCWTISVPFWS